MADKERFKIKLQQAFTGDNAYNPEVNPFAGYMQAQRKDYVQNAMNAWQADNANKDKTVGEMHAQEEALAAKFNQEKLPQYAEKLSSEAAGVYSGEVSKEAIAAKGENMVGDLGSSAAAGLMAGDMLGGVAHFARVSFLGIIGQIPFVGEFLSQLMSFAGSWIGKLFGGGEGLSWSEAGDKAKSSKAMERLAGAYGQTADMQVMSNIVASTAEEERQSASLPVVTASRPIEPADTPEAVAKKNPVPKVTVPGTGHEEATADDHAASPPLSTQTAAITVPQTGPAVTP